MKYYLIELITKGGNKFWLCRPVFQYENDLPVKLKSFAIEAKFFDAWNKLTLREIELIKEHCSNNSTGLDAFQVHEFDKPPRWAGGYSIIIDKDLPGGNTVIPNAANI